MRPLWKRAPYSGGFAEAAFAAGSLALGFAAYSGETGIQISVTNFSVSLVMP